MALSSFVCNAAAYYAPPLAFPDGASTMMRTVAVASHKHPTVVVMTAMSDEEAAKNTWLAKREQHLAVSWGPSSKKKAPVQEPKSPLLQEPIITQPSGGGKGFGGGEATRDPEPTVYDPNDPKGKQQAIHKAESFAEYVAKRDGSASSAGAAEPTASLDAEPDVAPSMPAPFTPSPSPMPERMAEPDARAAWLAKHDAPTWGDNDVGQAQRWPSTTMTKRDAGTAPPAPLVDTPPAAPAAPAPPAPPATSDASPAVPSMAGGKGFGGGEATRDPEPTVYDPNDPKGKQQAIHKAESFAEYVAKRDGSASSAGAAEPTASLDAEPDVAPSMPAPFTPSPSPMPERMAEPDARAAWLAKHDAPTWGDIPPLSPPQPTTIDVVALNDAAWVAASETLDAVASEAAGIEAMGFACDSGDVIACDMLSRETDAKKAWLGRLDAPSWGQAAAAVAEVAAMPNMSEEQAKKAWLARLDAPSWSQAADALSYMAATAEQMEDAKLSSLPEPSWNAAATTVTQVAIGAKAAEEEAKAAWLDRLDAPTWGRQAAAALSSVIEGATQAAAAVSSAVDHATQAAAIEENTRSYYPRYEAKARDPLSKEEEAKLAWLARIQPPAPAYSSSALPAVPAPAMPVPSVPMAGQRSESDARAAWLAKLDAPSWGQAADAMQTVATEAAQVQVMTEACDDGDITACDQLSYEEEAKKEWLTRVDAEAWGEAAANVMSIAEQASSSPITVRDALKKLRSEVDARRMPLKEYKEKRSLLLSNFAMYGIADLDVGTWTQAAAALTSAVGEASEVAQLTERCESGEFAACDQLSVEDAAKRAWLSNLDVPSWGEAAAAVVAVSDVAAEYSRGTQDSAESEMHETVDSGVQDGAGAVTQERADVAGVVLPMPSLAQGASSTQSARDALGRIEEQRKSGALTTTQYLEKRASVLKQWSKFGVVQDV